MTEERKRRQSRVLEALEKQLAEQKAAAAESGDDQPFLDFASKLGSDKREGRDTE